MAELERRLNRSSRNSSLPPSQDPPSAPPRPRGKGSGRKRGGQHGHEGRYRRLLPPEQVDEIVEHWPERCRSCAHEFAEHGARRCGRAVAASGRRAAADRGQGDRASAAPGLLPGVRDRDTRPSLPRERRGGRSGPGCRRRSSRSRSATASRAATRPSSPGSCSGSSSRPGRSTRSCSAPARRSPRPHTRLEQEIKRAAGRQHRRDRLEDRRRAPDALGRAHRAAPRSSGSRPAATPPRRRRCSASATPGSSAPTAGAATTTSTRPAGSSAGRTCSATSPPTAKGWANKRQFGNARPARSRTTSSPPGSSYQHDGDRARLQAQIAPLQQSSAALLEHAARKSTKDEVPPPVRPQPPQTLARPLDLHPHRRRRADQQPRRTRPPRRRHLPQALTRQPIRTRRTQPSNDSSPPRSPAGSAKRSLFAYLTDVLTAHARGDPIPALSLTATGQPERLPPSACLQELSGAWSRLAL